MWLFRSGFVLLLYAAMVVYSGIRLFALVKFRRPSAKAYIFWPVYVLFGFSYIIVFFLRFDRIWVLRSAVMYSLPFLVYLFLFLLLFDMVRLIFWLKKRKRVSPGVLAGFTGIALGLAVFIMIYGFFNARNVQTVNYEITINKKGNTNREKSLRIALVTDIHIGQTVNRKWLARIVSAVNKAKPDIICIAGDVFDGRLDSIKNLEGMAEELRLLNAPLGVYACQGNHDIDRASMHENGRADSVYEFLKTTGINYLLDEIVLPDGSFYLAGRRDARLAGSRKPAAELIADTDKSMPVIFMDHQPVDYTALDEAGADLILSGHTHKGQFFPGNMITALIYKKAGAVHYGRWQGRIAQGVVSSGAGLWGPPIRIATKSEVVVVDVKFK